MGKIFRINEPTIQTIGADIVRDAFRVTWTATPSDVTYSLLFAPVDIWTAEQVDAQGDLWADRWNSNALVQGVAGIVVTQQVDAAGNLVDVAQVTVISTSGNSTSLITVPVQNWLPSVSGTSLATAFPDVIRAEVQRLDAIEAGAPAAT